MKRYFRVAKDVGDLTRIIIAVLEHEHKKSLPILGSFCQSRLLGAERSAARFASRTGGSTSSMTMCSSAIPSICFACSILPMPRRSCLHPHAVKIAAKNVASDR